MYSSKNIAMARGVVPCTRDIFERMIKMTTVFLVTVLGICFFITTVNCYFQKYKYKYLTKDEKQKFNILNSPAAWFAYSFVIAIMIGIIFITSFMTIMNGYTNVGKQQNTINQQQTDTSQQTNN